MFFIFVCVCVSVRVCLFWRESGGLGGRRVLKIVVKKNRIRTFDEILKNNALRPIYIFPILSHVGKESLHQPKDMSSSVLKIFHLFYLFPTDKLVCRTHIHAIRPKSRIHHHCRHDP